MGAMGPPAPPALPVYLSGSCTAWPYTASACPCVCVWGTGVGEMGLISPSYPTQGVKVAE